MATSAEMFIFRNILWPSGSSQIFMSRFSFVLLLTLMVGSRIHYSSFASYFMYHCYIKKKLRTDCTWHSYVDVNRSGCYIGYEPARGTPRITGTLPFPNLRC